MRRTTGRLAATMTSVLLAAHPRTEGDETMEWFFGPFDEALSLAEERDTHVLVYFWMGGSENCVKVYEETLLSTEAAQASKPFVCLSAGHGEEGGTELFERYGISTVPAFRFIRPDGAADDGLDGFADPVDFSSQLERVNRGEGTLRDLERRSEAAPDDMELRNLVAGKYQDLGNQEEHDRIRESIKHDDPQGESEVAARLHWADAVQSAREKATRADEVSMELLYEHAAEILPESVRFQAFATIAYMESCRDDRKNELAAIRQAWATIPETNVLGWGDGIAQLLWANRDALSGEDEAFALELAQAAVERAEAAAEEGHDGYGNSCSSEDCEALLASRLNTLAKVLYMNGEKGEALSAIRRCVELAPDNAEYAARATLYGKRKADAPLHVYADVRPVWSPDGAKVAFTSDRDGNEEVYVADVRSGKAKRLTRNQASDSVTSWAPNGKALAFNSDRHLGNGIYTMKPNGSKVKCLVPFDPENPVTMHDPTFSPNGREIAFATYENGKSEIAVMKANGSKRRVLTAATPNTDMQPTWSGDEILFMSNRVGDSDVWAITPDGEEEVNITKAPNNSWDMDPEASPDGKKIVFSSWRTGYCEIFVMDADGKNVRNLTNSKTEDRHPRWSPDGSKIAFDRKLENGSQRVFVMNADGSNAEALLD